MSDAPHNNPDDPKLRPRKRIPWLLRVGLWTAIILHIVAFILFRIDSDYLPDREPSKPYVTFVSQDSFAKETELEEYASLFDSAPLFIPTRWNITQLIEVDFETVYLGQFSEFEPRIELLSELRPNGLLVADDYRVDKPADLLASRFWRFFEGFGRTTETITAFEETMPVAEVSLIGKPLSPAIMLKVDLEPAAAFSIPRPVSYMIGASGSGLVWGYPTLVETSGNEAFDQSVYRWLQRPDILAQLPVGYLLIRVFFW